MTPDQIRAIAIEVANEYFNELESEAMDAPWLRAFVSAFGDRFLTALAEFEKAEPVVQLLDDVRDLVEELRCNHGKFGDSAADIIERLAKVKNP